MTGISRLEKRGRSYTGKELQKSWSGGGGGGSRARGGNPIDYVANVRGFVS